MPKRRPGATADVVVHRLSQQSRGEFILPRRNADRELATRYGIELRRSACAGPAPARRPLVACREQPEVDELIQVIRGERSADAYRGGGLVPAYCFIPPGHVHVEAAAYRVIKATYRRDARLLISKP